MEVKLCTHSQCNCHFEKVEKHNLNRLVKIIRQRKINARENLSQKTFENQPKLLKTAWQLLKILKNDLDDTTSQDLEDLITDHI